MKFTNPLITSNGRPSYHVVSLVAISIFMVLVFGFHDALLELLSSHIENYFKAQQALVDAQYFAC